MFTTHHPARMIVRSALVAILLLGAAMPVRAQRMDNTRAGISPSQPSPPTRIARPAVRPDTTDLGPPISPRRAFLYSFLLPGAGQAKLDRAYAGGMFFLIEAAALTLLHRSAEDLRIARAFQGDSMPLRYQIDPVTGLATRDAGGAPVVAEWSPPRYDADFVRTRKLHAEDWIAVLFFNHLFAGADAFVAAQLWDLPTKLAIRQTPVGPLLSATIPFR